MENHKLILFMQSVLFDERASPETRRQAKAILAQLIDAMPIAKTARRGPGRPPKAIGEGSKKRAAGRPGRVASDTADGVTRRRNRKPVSMDTASGRLAQQLKDFLSDKPEILQDSVFKHLEMKKSQSTTIEVGKAMALLGYVSRRIGKAPNREVIYRQG